MNEKTGLNIYPMTRRKFGRSKPIVARSNSAPPKIAGSNAWTQSDLDEELEELFQDSETSSSAIHSTSSSASSAATSPRTPSSSPRSSVDMSEEASKLFSTFEEPSKVAVTIAQKSLPTWRFPIFESQSILIHLMYIIIIFIVYMWL
jgi:hypothetical protein